MQRGQNGITVIVMHWPPPFSQHRSDKATLEATLARDGELAHSAPGSTPHIMKDLKVRRRACPKEGWTGLLAVPDNPAGKSMAEVTTLKEPTFVSAHERLQHRLCQCAGLF